MFRRMWINQPSTLQKHHSLHGQRVLAGDEGDDKLLVYFAEGSEVFGFLPREALSPGWPGHDSPVPKRATRPDNHFRCKADQAWEMAGLARQDGDRHSLA